MTSIAPSDTSETGELRTPVALGDPMAIGAEESQEISVLPESGAVAATSDLPRHSMDRVLKNMERRMPWPVARLLLTRRGIKPSVGWQATMAKCLDGSYAAVNPDDLLDDLKDHIICGEKSVRLYKTDPVEAPKIVSALERIAISDGPMALSFPLYLDGNDLREVDTTSPQIVSLDTDDTDYHMILSTIKIFEERVPILSEDLPREAQDMFNQYSHIIGVRRSKTQTFDVIIFCPSTGELEIRVDAWAGMHNDVVSASHKMLLKSAINITGIEKPCTAVNFFPLIDKMYREPTEGKVVELSFTTMTASLKHERMRRREICLRSELYHKGGTKAVNGDIEPYRLGIEWEYNLNSELSSRPELFLNGNYMLLHTTGTELHEITIKNCTGREDFDFVKSRINHYLAQV